MRWRREISPADHHKAWPIHQRQLTFDEVEAAGLPAVFVSFGDLLLYKDGLVYALPAATQLVGLAQAERLPGSYMVTKRIGTEYPWLHARGCGCRFCALGSNRAAA